MCCSSPASCCCSGVRRIWSALLPRLGHSVPSPACGGGTGRGHATTVMRASSPPPHPPPAKGGGGGTGCPPRPGPPTQKQHLPKRAPTPHRRRYGGGCFFARGLRGGHNVRRRREAP